MERTAKENEWLDFFSTKPVGSCMSYRDSFEDSPASPEEEAFDPTFRLELMYRADLPNWQKRQGAVAFIVVRNMDTDTYAALSEAYSEGGIEDHAWRSSMVEAIAAFAQTQSAIVQAAQHEETARGMFIPYSGQPRTAYISRNGSEYIPLTEEERAHDLQSREVFAYFRHGSMFDHMNRVMYSYGHITFEQAREWGIIVEPRHVSE